MGKSVIPIKEFSIRLVRLFSRFGVYCHDEECNIRFDILYV